MFQRPDSAVWPLFYAATSILKQTSINRDNNMKKNLTPKEIKIQRILKRIVNLIIIAIIVTYGIQLFTTVKALKEHGYLNLVDVGEYELNVATFGAKNGEHRIVGIADLNDGDFSVSASRLTEFLGQKNRLIFIDRAGYGLSDDTWNAPTVEKVVKDYRKALQTLEIQAPYVLLAESYGGVYATYWETQYPEEIEAVIFIDGTEMHESEIENKNANKHHCFTEIITSAVSRLGWSKIISQEKYPIYPITYSQEEKVMGDGLTTGTLDSMAPVLETHKKWENIEKTYAAITRNTIPKLYISTNTQWRHKSPDVNSEQEFGDVVRATDKQPGEMLTPYLDKMGNCRLTYISGTNCVYEYNFEECGRIIQSFLSKLDLYQQTPVN